MPFYKFLQFLCIFLPKNTDGRMRKKYRILANFPAPCASLAANRLAIPQRYDSLNYYNQIGTTSLVRA